MGDGDVAAGHRRRSRKGFGFDAIRNHAMHERLHRSRTVHHHARRVGALDLDAAFLQGMNQVRDFRLQRRILDDGGSFCERCRHDCLHRRAHAGNGKHHFAATQAVAARLDVAVRELDARTEFLHRHQVQIDGTRSPRATARHAHPRAAVHGERGREHIDRRAHGAHEIVRRFDAVGIGGVDGEHVAVARGPGAEQVEHLHHGGDVLQIRHVGDDALAAREERCRHEREHRVLGTLDAHRSRQRRRSFDDEFIQREAPVARLPRGRGRKDPESRRPSQNPRHAAGPSRRRPVCRRPRT